jgi:hypothetical protein
MKLVLVCLLAGCSADRAAGKYQSDTGKGPIIELRADGTLDMPPHADPRCDDDKPALDACRTKQRWSRDGNKVTLQIGGVWSNAPGSIGGMFDKPGPPCECRLETHEATLDADTLAIGKERAVRIR